MENIEASRILVNCFGARITSLDGEMVLAVPDPYPHQFHEFRKLVEILHLDEVRIVAGHSFIEPMFAPK